MLLRFNLLSRRLDSRLNDIPQIQLLLSQGQLAKRDTGNVEQVVEQQRHVPYLAFDDLLAADLLRIACRC